MLTAIPITASLAGMPGQGFMSQNDAEYAALFRVEIAVDVDEETEPVRMPRVETLDHILCFALRATLATDPTR
jgi:hypothetical protein